MAGNCEIIGMGGGELAAAIRGKRISAREVMAACLDRIEAVNPALNAVVAMPPREALMAQAAAADERQARGETLGPLHGLPHAVKDLQAVKGLRFTQGSPIWPRSAARRPTEPDGGRLRARPGLSSWVRPTRPSSAWARILST